jgi:hypothetical protein
MRRTAKTVERELKSRSAFCGSGRRTTEASSVERAPYIGALAQRRTELHNRRARIAELWTAEDRPRQRPAAADRLALKSRESPPAESPPPGWPRLGESLLYFRKCQREQCKGLKRRELRKSGRKL